jgi:hypothetical protein
LLVAGIEPGKPAGAIRPYRLSATCVILSVVHRLVLIVFLALLTFDMSGLAAVCGDGPCDESCPTDVSGGQCPPNCHFCSCCSLPKVVGDTAVTRLTPPSRGNSWIRWTDGLPSPEPADILHVPKLLLS